MMGRSRTFVQPHVPDGGARFRPPCESPGGELLRGRCIHSRQIYLEARCHIVGGKLRLVREAADDFCISGDGALTRSEPRDVGRMPEDIRADPWQDRGGFPALSRLVVIPGYDRERPNSWHLTPRSGDEGSLHPLLVRIVVDSDEADCLPLLRNQCSQNSGAVSRAEIPHVDVHDVAGHIRLWQERRYEVVLVRIIWRHFEQSAAEFDAVADDEIKPVVGVPSRYLIHLSQTDILCICGLEPASRLELFQPVVSQLAPAAIGDNAREPPSDTGFANRTNPRGWDRCRQ